MAEKKEMIKNGDNIELDGVTVINKGISLSETKKEEPKVEEPVAVQNPVEEPIIPSIVNEISVAEPAINVAPEMPYTLPEISPTVVPTSPFDIPVSSPMAPEMPMGPEMVNLNNQSFVPPVSNEPIYNYDASITNTDFLTSGVYKSASDVDLAKSAFLSDVEAAYNKNIAGPTKTLVNLLNEFKEWGNEVTSQGLNRTLFEKFDELSARYDGMDIASYGDNEPDNNYGGMNF